MFEHWLIWLTVASDAINPTAGISGEDVGWVLATILSVLALVAAWDRRADKRTLEHIRRENQPIKDELGALRINQDQLMRQSGVEPKEPLRETNDS